MLIRKEFILTTLIVILTRGMPIIVLPLLTAGLSLSEYGLFTIFILLMNLAAPVITGNMAAGILREGIKFHQRGFKLLQLICISSLILVSFVLFVSLIADIKITYIFVSILIITTGHHECLIAYFRARYNDRKFLFLSIGRAISLLFPAILVSQNYLDFDGLLQYFCVGYVITSLIMSPHNLWTTPISKTHLVYLRFAFVYCIFLIPYAIGQWVISSSSRALVGKLDTLENAGIFAIAFTVASPIILLFSVCGIIFSRSIIAKPEKWLSDSKYRHKIIFFVILSALICTILSLKVILIDYKYFKLIKYYSPDLILVTGLTSISLLFHCMYSIYGNILFYLKATKILAANSIIIAIFHLFHSYILILKIGIIGAVVSLWISYFLIYISTFLAVRKKTSYKLVKSNIDVIILIVGMALQGFLVLYFHLEWNNLYISNY